VNRIHETRTAFAKAGEGYVMNARFVALCLILSAVYSAPSGAEDANVALTSEIPSLEGVWVLDMDGERASMVVYQTGSDLAGACTGDNPEPWNAVMAGSVSGGGVDLFALSIQDGVGVMIEILGEENGGAIRGSFVQADSLGGWRMGNLTGFKTSPDTSAYVPTPSTVQSIPSDLLMASTTPEGSTEDNGGRPVDMSAQRSPGPGERQVMDVTSQAERVFYLGWAWNPD
jgi:hypothetical protein